MKYSRFIFSHKGKIHSILKSLEDAEVGKFLCLPTITKSLYPRFSRIVILLRSNVTCSPASLPKT